MALLRKLTTAYKQGDIGGLVQLYGRSDVLTVLVARSTRDAQLCVLCQCGLWDKAVVRIGKIATQAAIEEMHEKDEKGRTALATAIVADAPVKLLKRMVELDKQDP